MLHFITKIACAGFILALPLQAMQLQQEQETQNNNQEQSQVKEVKNLKVQALLKIAQSPEISDEQINQLPQELRKIARVIRRTQGNMAKALLCALKARKNVLKVARMLADSNINNQNLFVHDFWYSLDDICLLVKCCQDEGEELHLLYAIRFQDNELLELIGKKTLSRIVHDKLTNNINGTSTVHTDNFSGNTGDFLLSHLFMSVNGHKFEVRVKDEIKSIVNLIISAQNLP